jgi:hypothetical protein
MSKVWLVTGGAGGLDACGLTFCGLAVPIFGSHGSRLQPQRASGQVASYTTSIAREHS